MVDLEFRLERFIRPEPGPVEAFARGISGVLASMPAAIPLFSFGRAERMSSGLLDSDTALWADLPNPDGDKRIRMIEHAGEPLLRFRYDDAGRLIETVFPGGRTERLLRDRDGGLNAVRWCDTEMTNFRFHENARLASIEYADGASFKFQSNPRGACDTWRYPDGKACVAAWDSAGLLESLTCGDVNLRYVWNGSYLASIATGEHRLPLDSRRFSILFEEVSAGSSGIRQIQSAIGNWTYDHNDNPIELVSPFLARLRRLTNESQRTVTIWTPTGQTIWKFTRRGLLDSIVHADGTRTIFVNSSESDIVFALSSRGVECLRYRNGRLVASRAMDGSSVRWTYGRSASPSSIVSPSGEMMFKQAEPHRLTEIRARSRFVASVSGGIGASVRFRNRESDRVVPLAITTAWLWEWCDYPKRMRLGSERRRNSGSTASELDRNREQS